MYNYPTHCVYKWVRVSWEMVKVRVKIFARNVDQTTERWQQRPRVQLKEVWQP